MSPPLLTAERSQLLIVDVQERLLPAMASGEGLVERVLVLAQACRRLDVPATASEQYPKGLGTMVPALVEGTAGAPRFEKLAFSCLADPPLCEHLARLRSKGRHQLVIAGIEAHVCVLQTALEARDRGYDVFVVADAVASRAPRSVEVAMSRMVAGGVVPVTTEMVVFEWLGHAGTKAFKDLSPLFRR